MAAMQADAENTGDDGPGCLTISFPMSVKTETKEAADCQQSIFTSELTGRRKIMVDNRNGRKKRIHFTEENDLEILGLVARQNPFLEHKKWLYIAELMKKRRLKRFTPKNVRERVVHLINTFREEKSQVRPGQKLSELNKRLQVAYSLRKYANMNPQLIKKREKKRYPTADTSEKSRKNADPAHVREDHGSYTVQIVNRNDELSLDDGVEPKLQCMVSRNDLMERILNESDSVPCSGLPTTTFPVASPTIAPFSQDSGPNPLATSTRISQSCRKSSKNLMDQELLVGLYEDKECKSQVLALEMLKAENDKRRLIAEDAKAKMDYELETKRIKLKEQQLNLNESAMNLMNECLKQNQKMSEQLLSMIRRGRDRKRAE